LPPARGRGILWPMSDSQEAVAVLSGAAVAGDAAAPPAPEWSSETSPPPRACEARSALCAEIGKRIIGSTDVIEHLLIALFSRGHCLFVGVPGLAKTMLIQTLADVLDLSFGRIQFTPDLMPSDITGSDVLEEDRATGRRVFRFVRGPIFANVILADEINRTPPKTQAALLQSMQEYRVSAGGTTYNLPLPFLVFATQNPIEQEGTYPCPKPSSTASCSRWTWAIPTPRKRCVSPARVRAATTRCCTRCCHPSASWTCKAWSCACRWRTMSCGTRWLSVAPPGRRRPRPPIGKYVAWGAGPRASQHLVLAAKARAVLDGRYAVSIEDVRRMALPVLVHRLVRNFHAEADGVSSRALIERLLQTVQPD